MECSFPPPLSDDELSEAIDGPIAGELARHLAGCPACAARLAEARRFEAALGAALFRWDCPPAGELAAHALGHLPAEAADQAEQHLLACPACAAEADELRRYLGGPADLPAPPRPQVRGPAVAHAPRRAPPALAARSTAAEPLVIEAGPAAVILQLRPGSDGQALLIGQVVAGERIPWAGGLVEARQGGALRAVAAVDADGGFSLALKPGEPASLWLAGADDEPLLIEGVAVELT